MNDDFEEDAECKEEVIGAEVAGEEVAGAEVVEEVEEAKEEEAEEGALNDEVAKEDDLKEDEAVKEEAVEEELVAVAVVVVAVIVGSRLGGRTTMVITRSTPHKASKMWLRLSGSNSSSSRDKSDPPPRDCGGGFLESCPILKMSRLCCVFMYARSLRRSTLQIFVCWNDCACLR
jgi:hypothetical protein